MIDFRRDVRIRDDFGDDIQSQSVPEVPSFFDVASHALKTTFNVLPLPMPSEPESLPFWR